MIHSAKNSLMDRGFDEARPLEDSFGTIGYWMHRGDEQFVLVAKNYAYNNLASFMAPVIEWADEEKLIFYADDVDSFTVFNQKYVNQNGNASQGESKKRNCSWIEIDRSYGVDLFDYLNGRKEPRTIAEDNQQLSNFQ